MNRQSVELLRRGARQVTWESRPSANRERSPKGARAIARYAKSEGVTIESHDSSGLSYANQISPAELALLVELSEDEKWYTALRSGLAAGGDGTLKERLHQVRDPCKDRHPRRHIGTGRVGVAEQSEGMGRVRDHVSRDRQVQRDPGRGQNRSPSSPLGPLGHE